MTNNHRIAKVSSLLKKEITLIIQNDFENQLAASYFINISKIVLTADLQSCTIYITLNAEEQIRKEIVENLNLEDLGGICFNSDIYSIKHENLKTRIYKT